MAITREKLASCDPVWEHLRAEAESDRRARARAGRFIHATILKHDQLENALSYHMARKLGGEELGPLTVRETFEEAIADDPRSEPRCAPIFRRCWTAIRPAIPSPRLFSYYKGFHALECYRIAHWLWRKDRKAMALFFQSRMSQLFAVDINPAARLGAAS